MPEAFEIDKDGTLDGSNQHLSSRAFEIAATVLSEQHSNAHLDKVKFPSRTGSSKSADSSTVKSLLGAIPHTVSEILEDDGSRETVEEFESYGSHHEPGTEDDVVAYAVYTVSLTH